MPHAPAITARGLRAILTLILALSFCNLSAFETIEPLGATTVPIPNPSFESGLGGWIATNGQRVVPTTADAFQPVPNGNACVVPTPGACINNAFAVDLVQQVAVLQPDSLYECTVDVFPLSGQDHRLQFRILDSSTTYENYDAALYRPPWNDGQQTHTLIPGQWNRVRIGFSSTDLPAYNNLPFFIQVAACGMAVDNVRLLRLPLIISPGNTTYYVSSTSGNDAFLGVQSFAPWKSFDNTRKRRFSSGDRILLRRGDTWDRPLELRGNGVPGNPVTLGSYSAGELPMIRLEYLENGHAVTVHNASHWRIENIAARKAKLGLYLRYYLSYENSDVVVEDCHFSDMDSWTVDLPSTNYEVSFNSAIFVGGRVGGGADQTRTVLDGLTIRNVAMENCTAGFLAGWYYPELIYDRIKNLLIEDSHATKVTAGGVCINSVQGAVIRRFRTFDPVDRGNDFVWGTTGGIVSSSRDILFEDCEFSETDRRWFDDQAGDGCGLDIDGRNIDITVRDTVFHNNDGPGLLFLSTFGVRNFNVLIEDSTFYNNGLDGAVSFGGNAFEIKIPIGTLSGTFRNLGLYRSEPSWGWMHNPQPSQVTLDSLRYNWHATDVASRPAAQWTFETLGNLQGWSGFNDWAHPTVANGVLSGTAQGEDPFVISPSIWMNTHRERALLVEMSVDAPTPAQLFFLRETHPTWHPDRSFAFEVVPDGQLHHYELDLRSIPSYRGVVTRLRLDPTLTAGAHIRIGDIRALANTTTTRSAAPTNLSARRLGDAAQLSWEDASSTEEHFIIERAINHQPFTWLATLPLNTTAYTDDSPPQAPDTARYRVRSFNRSGYSVQGAEALLAPSPHAESLQIF